MYVMFWLHYGGLLINNEHKDFRFTLYMYMSLEQGLIEEWAYNVLGVEVLLCLHYELSLGRKSH